MRVVVLHHDGIDSPHYDLLIEPHPGAPLWTWRLPHWPPLPDQTATRFADHRNEYLHYQGPIASNRGRVRQVFAGQCNVSATDEVISLIANSTPAPFANLRLSRQRDDVWMLFALPPD